MQRLYKLLIFINIMAKFCDKIVTIMQNMIELAPTSVVPWFEEELNIFAWLDDVDKPFNLSVQDWDGTEKSVTVEGQCLCGYGDKRWMSLEMFSPEFEGEFPSNHRFSVLVHEYYHVYQSTLSESSDIQAPTEITNFLQRYTLLLV